MMRFSPLERFRRSLRNLQIFFEKHEKLDRILFLFIAIPVFIFVLMITLLFDLITSFPITTFILIPLYFIFFKKGRIVFLILYTLFAVWLTIGYYIEVRENDKNKKIIAAATEKYLAEKKQCPTKFSDLVKGGFLLENEVPQPYHGHRPDPRSSWVIEPNEKEQKCDVHLARGAI